MTPSTTVKEVAELFLEKRISAVPVVDSQQKLVGIVSEGNLLHRVEAGTERRRSDAVMTYLLAYIRPLPHGR